VQIRAVRTPERGGGDLRFERELLPVENGIDLLRRGAVESGRNLREAAAERAGNQNAPRQVERFDPDPPEACFFRQSFELDRAVDAAVAVEVVEMVEEGGIREIEPVVDQDDEFMPGAAAGVEFILLKRIRQFVEPDLAPVPEDAAAQPECADPEPEPDAGRSFHAAAVDADSAPARIFRRRVETAGHGREFAAGDAFRIDRFELRCVGAEE